MNNLVRKENYSGAFKRKHHWYRNFGNVPGARFSALALHKKLCGILDGEEANLYIMETTDNHWLSVVEFDQDYIEPLLILEFDREENV